MISGSIIMVLGVVQALFFISLLISKKKRASSESFLGTYLALVSVHLIYYFFIYYQPASVPTYIGILGFSLVILHTPIFFLYIRSLVYPGRVPLTMILLNLLPYLVYNLIFLYGHYYTAAEITPYKGFLMIDNPSAFVLLKNGEIMALICVMYIIWGFFMLREYNQNLKQQISNDGFSYSRWLYFLVVSYLIFFLSIYFVIKSALDYEVFDPDYVFLIVSLIIVAYIFIIGYTGLRSPSVFIEPIRIDDFGAYGPEDASDKKGKYSKSGLTPEDRSALAEKVKQLLQSNKPHCDPETNLSSLAQLIPTSPTYLSQVINQEFRMNFYDLINRYRVEEVKSRLQSGNYDHYSLLAIAFDCGFKSKSAFNGSFRKHTGMTPSEFKESIRQDIGS